MRAAPVPCAQVPGDGCLATAAFYAGPDLAARVPLQHWQRGQPYSWCCGKTVLACAVASVDGSSRVSVHAGRIIRPRPAPILSAASAAAGEDGHQPAYHAAYKTRLRLAGVWRGATVVEPAAFAASDRRYRAATTAKLCWRRSYHVGEREAATPEITSAVSGEKRRCAGKAAGRATRCRWDDSKAVNN